MSSNLTTLTRPIRRKVKELNLVVEIRITGLRIKGLRKQRWYFITWWEILSLISDQVERNDQRKGPIYRPLLNEAERIRGVATAEKMTRFHRRNGARQTTSRSTKPHTEGTTHDGAR